MCVQPKSFKGFIRHKMTLSNSKLEYVESYNYLGVNISSDMSDDKAIYKQCQSMYAKGNVLIRNFKACTDNVKRLLFNSYCSDFYCSALWINFKSESLRRLKTAYNRVFRKLFNLKGQISVSECLVARRLNPFIVLLRKAIYNLRQRVFKSNNSIVRNFTTCNLCYLSQLHCYWERSICILT